MPIDQPTLSDSGLQRFHELRADAIAAVTDRFYATHGSLYARFGARGRTACREDLGHHLDFLRPVLEFGDVLPMVDYLRWLAGVLATRDVPATHLAQSLDWLGEFFGEAIAGSEGRVVVTALQQARDRFLEPDDAPSAIYGLMPSGWPECAAFESALLAGDAPRARLIFEDRLAAGRGLVDAELHLIQPALYAIGQKWQSNQVTVVQEHLATAISQAVMTQGLEHASALRNNGRKVLLACVEGNHHAVGLQMVADALQLEGWEVQFLGANVPTGALITHIGQWGPALVGLSVSFAHQLHVVRDIMARLIHAHGAARPPVMVGGLAINQFSGLAGQLGVDAWSADASAAVTTAWRLAGLRHVT